MSSGKSPLDLTHISNEVIPIVRISGQFAQGKFGKSEIVNMKDEIDYATDVDLQVEERITSFLQNKFPNHGILSEESGVIAESTDLTWVLDPIDGTKHFHNNIPLYSIALALKSQKETLLGIVFIPETNEMYTAIKGDGAYRNNKKITIRTDQKISDSMLCLELPKHSDQMKDIDTSIHIFRNLIDISGRIRVLGVTSIGLCYTAANCFGGFISLHGKSPEWDTCAGILIAEESEARIGYHGDYLIVTNNTNYTLLFNHISEIRAQGNG